MIDKIQTENLKGTPARLRRAGVFGVLLAFVSLACVCSTENLPGFLKNILQKETPTSLPGTVVLQDDFSDPNSGWEEDVFDTGSLGYSQGKYVVTSTYPSTAIWGVAGQDYTDVVIEVEATQVRAPASNNNDYGVMCRVKLSGDGYSFNISGDGYYSIQKMTDNAFSDLVGWTESSAIRKGNSTNRLGVVCQGNHLSLYVNGTLLAEVTDNAYSEGDIALSATTYEDQATEVQFDNLVVRKP
jgi:hypothetical protein